MKRVLIALLFAAFLPAAAHAADDVVKIPMKDVSAEAKFFKETVNGVTVKFFVVKAPDGSVRSALDACDVCFPAKKGYKQTGEFMTCVNCGQKFHVSRVGMTKGGCNPHPVQNTVEGDQVIIKKAELADGLKYFQ